MPGHEFVNLASILFHEYIHTKDMRTGMDCEANGGNPDQKKDLQGNPCDCAHSYVYAKQIRMLYALQCAWPEEGAPVDGTIWWAKTYQEKYVQSWKNYRKSCEELGLTNEPPDGESGPFHSKTLGNPDGIPFELVNS